MQRASLFVIITHVASWLLFLSLPVVFITSQSNNIKAIAVLSSFPYWLCFLFFISLFYLHTYFLFPRFYQHNQKLFYFVSVVVLFALLLWLKPFDRLMTHWRPNGPRNEQRREDQPPPNDNFGKPFPPPGINNNEPLPPQLRSEPP